MKFIHFEIDADPNCIIRISLDNHANIRLMDDKNFEGYSTGHMYKFYGGFITEPTYDIRPPKKNHWHIIVDLGGQPGKVKAGMQMFRM